MRHGAGVDNNKIGPFVGKVAQEPIHHFAEFILERLDFLAEKVNIFISTTTFKIITV